MEPIRTGRMLAPTTTYEAIIEDNLGSYETVGSDRIFASRAGLCARQTAGMTLYKGTKPPNKRQASSEFYFKIGSAFEDVVDRAFENSGLLLDRETRVECYHPRVPVSGRIDFVIHDPKGGEDSDPLLVELKTCGKLPTKPKHYQVAQLLTYLVLTGMKKGLLWYVSRNVADWSGTIQQTVFEIEPSKTQRERVTRTMVTGAIYAEKGLLPAKPKKMKKYKCGFCSLVPMCWESKEPYEIGLDVLPWPKDLSPIHSEIDQIVKDIMREQDELRTQFLETVADRSATW